ncbi:hypothetical protein XI05_10220 [Bradyrhizobium sp. CCBAU 11357]|nr:hypothetical protein [Bradyrhizobium sp. CCBAU 11357]
MTRQFLSTLRTQRLCAGSFDKGRCGGVTVLLVSDLKWLFVSQYAEYAIQHSDRKVHYDILLVGTQIRLARWPTGDIQVSCNFVALQKLDPAKNFVVWAVHQRQFMTIKRVCLHVV